MIDALGNPLRHLPIIPARVGFVALHKQLYLPAKGQVMCDDLGHAGFVGYLPRKSLRLCSPINHRNPEDGRGVGYDWHRVDHAPGTIWCATMNNSVATKPRTTQRFAGIDPLGVAGHPDQCPAQPRIVTRPKRLGQ